MPKFERQNTNQNGTDDFATNVFSLDMQPLPKTYLGFYQEWRKINPSNHGPMAFLRERLRSGEDVRRAQILSYAYDSHSINRSAYHTIMIVFGESGVGKSSTINHLFGANVARTSSTKSETRKTTEFVLTEDDIEMGVKDLTLGIIDTPGFNDTEGIEQDACNLACIQNMLSNHESLQSLSGKSEARLFPNVILILVKATDKRFEGQNSNFAKCLLAVKDMGIVDTSRNNVLVVLTNVMSFGNPNNPKKWRNQLKTRSKKIRSIVEKNLEVSPEVVWVENHYQSSLICTSKCEEETNSDQVNSMVLSSSEEDEEEEGHCLKVDGEWTLLPDGTKQILNLYKGIADLFKANGDNLALHTMNLFFKTCYDGPVSEAKSWDALDAKKDRGKFGPVEQRMLTLLKRDCGLTEKEVTTDSAIKDKIEQWISMKTAEGQLDEFKAMEAYRLSVILTSQLKITKEAQIAKHNLGTIRQNLPNPDTLTSLHATMLEDIFGVKEEKRRPPIVSCLGRGYDIIHDEIKARCIFDFPSDDYVEVDYGLQVPRAVNLNIARQTSTFMEDFQTEEEYIRRRLSDLQVSLETIDTKIFHMKNRGGFTRSKNSSSRQSVQQYSYLLEKRLFQLTLTDLEEKSLLTFSASFQKALKSVPNVYDPTNSRSVRDLQDFFNNWGQYVVVQAYAGGSMEVQLSTVHSQEADGISNLIAARIKLSGMLHSLANAPRASYGFSGDKGNLTTDTDSTFMASSSINWRGGDTAMQVPSLDNINADILYQWEQSLAIKPSVLTTDLTLVPIYELVDDEAKRLTLRSALDDLLSGGLKTSSSAFRPTSSKASTMSAENKSLMGSVNFSDITSQFRDEAVESYIDSSASVKTRKAAIELKKPATRCCII